MRPLKVTGAEQVESLLGRTRKLRAMSRVSGPDAAYIEERLMEVQAKIASMSEVGEDGEEVRLDA